MEDEKVYEDYEETVETEEVEEEMKSKGFFTKAVAGLKKHGKKIAAGAVVAAVGFIGYALGSRSKDDELESNDVDTYDALEDHSADETTEE